jgi:beta-glucosidase
MKSLLL